MKELFLALIFMCQFPIQAGIERLNKGKSLPEIKLSQADSILVAEHLKKQKKSDKTAIIQMVCTKERKRYSCKPVTIKTP